jgi:IS5 family transposase
VLQTLYTLSDDQTEYQLNDRLSFMRFVGLALHDPVPDAKTIWLYREQLARVGAAEKLFARFDALLRAKGWLAMGGQIVDATVIEARRPRLTQAEKDTIKGGGTPAEWTPARRAQIDHDGRWTIKRGRKRETAGDTTSAKSTSRCRCSATRNTSASIASSVFCVAIPSPMPRRMTVASSAPCWIAATPPAMCGPTRPIALQRTWTCSAAAA